MKGAASRLQPSTFHSTFNLHLMWPWNPINRALTDLGRTLSYGLADLRQALSVINLRVNTMSEQLDTLTAQVAAIETVGASAIALLHGLKTALDEAIAANDPAALTALSTRLEAESGALAAALTENTPAA